MSGSPEFETQMRNIVLPKFDQAGKALMSGQTQESENTLSSIPKELLRGALGIALSYADMQEGKDKQKLFIALKIADKLFGLMNPDHPRESAFSIWAANDEDMNKYWDKFALLRQSFKENPKEFNRDLDHMTLYDVIACGQFSTVYTTLSTLKPYIDRNNPNNDASLRLHLDLASTLVRKAFALKAKKKDIYQ